MVNGRLHLGEVLPGELDIAVCRSYVGAAVLANDEAAQCRLPIGEARVERDHPTAGGEHLRRHIEQLLCLLVIDVMQHALSEHQVELTELLGVKVVDTANRERAAAVEPTTRRRDVGSVRINTDICDLREEPQDVSWPTPDVEHPVSSL